MVRKPPSWRLFCCGENESAERPRRVFNTTVDNPVEKGAGIVVSNSAEDGSAFCTGASAGTFVVHHESMVSRISEFALSPP
jgi:hypothetical protein